jgi:hypothetical protein
MDENERQYHREWKRNARDDYKARHLLLCNKRIANLKELVLAYKVTHPCVDCGESDPIVLDFDHVRGKKAFDVSFGAHRAYSWEHILKEIAKCEIRCANCHRRITHARRITSPNSSKVE